MSQRHSAKGLRRVEAIQVDSVFLTESRDPSHQRVCQGMPHFMARRVGQLARALAKVPIQAWAN